MTKKTGPRKSHATVPLSGVYWSQHAVVLFLIKVFWKLLHSP